METVSRKKNKYIDELLNSPNPFNNYWRRQDIVLYLQAIESCLTIDSCIAIIPQCLKLNSEELNRKLDDKFYSLCNSISDYQQYLKKLGNNARHAKDALNKIQSLKEKEQLKSIIETTVFVLCTIIIAMFFLKYCYD